MGEACKERSAERTSAGLPCAQIESIMTTEKLLRLNMT